MLFPLPGLFGITPKQLQGHFVTMAGTTHTHTGSFPWLFHPVALRNPGTNSTFCGKRRMCWEQGREAESRLCCWCPRSRFPSHRQVCVGSPGQEAAGKAIPHGEPLLQHPLPQNPAAARLLMEEAAPSQQLLLHVGKLLLATFGWEREEKEQHR